MNWASLSSPDDPDWRTAMILKIEHIELADLVSELSVALATFSNEAEKLSAILARSDAPVSPETYDELRKQTIAEVQAFEEYLNRKEEIFEYLEVESRQA
jgi:hypothetical protein